MDAVEVEGGGKRKAHTGAGGTGSSPEDMNVDRSYKKKEKMLTGRESREGWKAGRGKYAVDGKGKGGGPKGDEV